MPKINVFFLKFISLHPLGFDFLTLSQLVLLIYECPKLEIIPNFKSY